MPSNRNNYPKNILISAKQVFLWYFEVKYNYSKLANTIRKLSLIAP